MICRSELTSRKPGSAADLVEQNRRPVVERRQVGVLERVLVDGLAKAAADPDRRELLRVDVDPGDARELVPQVLDDLVDARALRAGLEPHEEPPRIGRRIDRARPDRGHELPHVRLLLDDGGDGPLVLAHAVEGDVLGGLGEGEDLPGVLVGDEARLDAVERRNGRPTKSTAVARIVARKTPIVACGWRRTTSSVRR